MNWMFPMMFDRPERKTVIGGSFYWAVYVIGLPFILLLIADSISATAIVFLLYFISFLAVGAIFFSYLKDSFLNVRFYPKRFFAAVGISGGVVLTVEFFLLQLSLLSPSIEIIMASHNILPFAELPLMLAVSASTIEMPLLMTLCNVIFVPVTMCCLYYGVGFAPIAQNRPWLGYLVMALLAAVPRLVGLGNTGYPLYQLVVYLWQLPWHLCACWAYQKADTIWAPIAMYAAVNLISSVSWILLVWLTYGI